MSGNQYRMAPMKQEVAVAAKAVAVKDVRLDKDMPRSEMRPGMRSETSSETPSETDASASRMVNYPRAIKLKDGTQLALRPIQKSDMKKLHAFFCALPEQDRLYLKEDVTDQRVIERWIEQMDHERVLAILACRNGEVVGDATLHFEQAGWARHVGEIRCVVANELQNNGLGTQLVQELVQHAMDRKLKKVSVMMMDCQQKAHKTFERIGFRKAATLPGYVVDIHGTEHDLVIMINEPEDIWRRMEDLMFDMDFRGDRSQ